jgi:cell division protein DivIC
MSTPFFTKYRFLKNKYLLVILFFLVWMTFFDPKDWGLIASRMEKLNNLEVAEKQLSGQISETRAELLELKTSAATIEKYARERFRMKKDNEEVFICK